MNTQHRLVKLFVICAIIIFSANMSFAQNVGINATGAAPNNAAMLDVSATNKGLMAPTVSLTATNLLAPVTTTAAATTAAGCLVYNVNTSGTYPTNVVPGYYYWDGTKWVQFMYSIAPVVPGTPTYFTTGTYSCTSATASGTPTTGSSFTWSVPAGIYQINVFVCGGGGGGSYTGSEYRAGGNGGVVTGVIDVVPGETFTLYVGAGGTGYNGFSATAGKGGTGSYILGTRSGATTLMCQAGGGGGCGTSSPTSTFNPQSTAGGGSTYSAAYPSNGGTGSTSGGSSGAGGSNYTGWLRNGIAFRGTGAGDQMDISPGVYSGFFTASWAGGAGYGTGGVGDGATANICNGTKGIIVIQW